MSRRGLVAALLVAAGCVAVPDGLATAATLAPTAIAPTAIAAPRQATAADPVPSGPDRLAYSLAKADEPPSGGYGMALDGLGSMAFDGTDRRVLVPRSAGLSYSPQWSPDGRWLTFTNWPDSADYPRVMAIPRDGGEPQLIADDADAISWSPDGLRLAWVARATDSTPNALMVAAVVDAGAVLVVAPAQSIYSSDREIGEPKFSPDGQRIAFSEGTRDVDADVFVLPSTGGQPQQLTHHIEVSDDLPSTILWSPAGSKLLVIASTVIDGERMPEPFVVSADGSDQHMVWNPTSRKYTFGAAWSPDGSEIALTDNSFWDGVQIWGTDGVLHKRIADGRRIDWAGPIAYTPDGSELLVVADVGEHTTNGVPGAPPDLWALPLDDDPIVRITSDHSVFPSLLQTVDPGLALRDVGVGPIAESVSVSRAAFHRAPAVVLAARDAAADALSVAPVAAHAQVPVLLTGDRLGSGVLREIRRLHAGEVVVVGAVADRVVAALQAHGLATLREGKSDNPYAVAVAVSRGLTAKTAVLAALPAAHGSWQSPLAAAGYAAARKMPMLYVKHRRLPVRTAQALRAHGTTRVVLVGNIAAVSDSVVHALEHRGIAVRRIGGSAYDASARLASMAQRRGAQVNHLFMTSAQSLTVPAAAGARGVVSVLVARDTLRHSPATRSWLAQHRRAIRTGRLVGAPATVRPRVETQLERLL